MLHGSQALINVFSLHNNATKGEKKLSRTKKEREEKITIVPQGVSHEEL
jgi:hypothetical protein